MLLGFYSDIHGNLDALVFTLDGLRALGVDYLFCGGDVAGYGARPNECLELIRFAQGDERVERARVDEILAETSLADPGTLADFLAVTPNRTVKGNHDHAAVTPGAELIFNSFAARAIIWTRRELSDENIGWLEELPLSLDIAENGLPAERGNDSPLLFRLVHASPHEPERWHYLLNRQEIKRAFNSLDVPFCFIGHTHQPVFFEQHEDGYIEVITDSDIVPSLFRRYIINVGSTGQPRDNDPRACAATFGYGDSLRKMKIRLHRFLYDNELAAERILKANLPPELAGRLLRGV